MKKISLHISKDIIIAFIFILITNFVLFLNYQNKIYIFNDFSRELYVPYAMNNGGVLYHDILNVYAPLGYQIIAFLISVFSDKLYVFSLAGFINSIFISFGLYFIIDFFLPKRIFLNFATLFLISSACFYTVFPVNFTYPYSYSICFGLDFFIWSLVFLLNYQTSKKTGFFFLSSAFFGAAVCCKYEFILVGIIFAVIFFQNISDKKFILKSLGSFFFVPFISYADLLLRGATFTDLKRNIEFVLDLSKAESVKTLYLTNGYIPAKESFYGYFEAFKTFIKTSVNILNFKENIGNFFESNVYIFYWTGILLLICFFVFYKKIKEHKEFLILYVATLLYSLKCIFNISFNSYGTYFFPLIFICLSILIIKLTNDYLKNKFIKSTVIFIISVSILNFGILYFVSNILRSKYVYSAQKITTSKGYFIPEKEFYEASIKTIDYIEKNTDSSDKILFLPEGAAFNYFTNRKSDNKYYYLIPSNIEVFKEKNIISDLKSSPPDYIFINNKDYYSYNKKSFCNDFGLEICDFIKEEYVLTEIFGNNQVVAIFKRKQQNN